ncbi:MAG: class I tRNA ligase family protein [Candidatus Moranbacteria bacterium]|nr:class I tRNA ligase family protein [Candidatus Moranbacteria bacterium]
MNGRYNPENIEGKWQKIWEEQGTFRQYGRGKKFYALDMFPYPSGAGLHVGHPKGYISTDVIARMKQLQGFAVLHPMGWDAFGLPAEQYAIKNRTHPNKTTRENVATFKQQLGRLGFTYDWDREINTTDPEYYRWTQWIFLQMFKKGLAYESYEPIIWCPSCQTGLANEDLENGACERCGTVVEKKPMRQWVLRITDYADRLLEGLGGLDWPESIKESQRNWIGRSEGTIVKFRISNFEFPNEAEEYIDVFTTRVDTLFGCTYVVVAPEHPLVRERMTDSGKRGTGIKNQEEILAYLEETKKKTEMERTAEGREKTGVRLEGIMAVNPINGEEVPVFVADYVLGDYGTGAVMAVPAHDTRDAVFARKYGLPVRQSVTPDFSDFERTEKTLQALDEVRKAAKERGIDIWVLGGLSCAFHAGIVYRGHDDMDLIVKDAATQSVALEVFSSLGYREVKRKKLSEELTNVVYANDQGMEIDIGPNIGEFGLTDEDFEEDEKVLSGHGALVLSLRFAREFKEYQLQGKKREKDAVDWEYLNGKVFVDDGFLVNSEIFSGLSSKDAREKITEKLESEGRGKKVVKYKLREWVFSRQRYWGEPIPLVHCESCAANEAAVKLTLNFREEKIWKLLLSGKKTVETRALNPDEPERYFGDVAEGDTLRFAFKPTGETKLFRVKTAYRFKDVRELFESEKKDLHGKIFSREFSTAEELEESYTALSPDYVKRIRENGLVGWELEPMHVSRVVPVPESELPVVLPDVESYEPTGTGESPLAGIDDWVNTTCPVCGGPAKRETNTMPQWAGSSWYYLRYIDPKNQDAIVDKKDEQKWMPVDAYVGGAEHATRHLIYARFWHKLLFDIGAVSTDEPFRKLVNVGLILASDGRKMSKRWGNVINPDDMVRDFGADAMRLYEMFMGPFSQNISWSTDGVIGTRRFLEKVWKLSGKVSDSADAVREIDGLVHRTVVKVTDDIDAFRFNTGVSSLMILANAFEKEQSVAKESYGIFLRLLSPFAPHMAEELWTELGNTESIFLSSWPEADPTLLVEDTVTIVVSVNGKVRDSFEISADATEDDLKAKALGSEKVAKFLDGKEPKRVIVIPGKLVNLVV